MSHCGKLVCRVRRDHWKGMSREERAAYPLWQLQQMELKAQQLQVREMGAGNRDVQWIACVSKVGLAMCIMPEIQSGVGLQAEEATERKFAQRQQEAERVIDQQLHLVHFTHHRKHIVHLLWLQHGHDEMHLSLSVAVT